jgi:hypothetical protein
MRHVLVVLLQLLSLVGGPARPRLHDGSYRGGACRRHAKGRQAEHQAAAR